MIATGHVLSPFKIFLLLSTGLTQDNTLQRYNTD